jgi:hypothetical protein
LVMFPCSFVSCFFLFYTNKYLDDYFFIYSFSFFFFLLPHFVFIFSFDIYKMDLNGGLAYLLRQRDWPCLRFLVSHTQHDATQKNIDEFPQKKTK